ncbi:amidohydrolase family protein [candidate division CSSED10-310 bacterium]|uniref:Amidohydrolase family protein n=1 Tax=candidate division CSSED10-310 bacterium TaxID=2855610 RepID=A0ABV6Z669_UNCC1
MKILKNMTRVATYFVTEMVNHGVKLLVGQDGFSAENTLNEMELLRDCGLGEAEIILGASLYPAQWLGLDHQTGSLTENKTADIVLLHKNPLEDIRNIHTSAAVIKNGKFVFADRTRDVYSS